MAWWLHPGIHETPRMAAFFHPAFTIGRSVATIGRFSLVVEQTTHQGQQADRNR